MKFFGNKNKKIKTKPVEPRSMDEILKDNQELKTKAADAQYLIYVYTKQLESLNQDLLKLNQEGAARQQLDAEAKKSEQSTGDSNVQV